MTALGLDGKWKHLTGSLGIWNDTGLLATFFDASVGYKFKVGALDLGTRLFVSDNMTWHQINGIATFEVGQEIPGLHIKWRAATNFINAPYPQTTGSNVEFGIEGKWNKNEALTYNLGAKMPFRGNPELAINFVYKLER